MRGFFTGALAAYDQADFIVRMKARFMLSVNLVLLLLIVIVLAYTCTVQIPLLGVGITPVYLMLVEVSLLFVALGALVMMIRGHFSLASHLLVIGILVTNGLVMIFDKSHALSRLDSVVIAIGILAMTPLIITRYKFLILLYGAAILAFFYGYVWYFWDALSVPSYAMLDYLGDNTVTLVFVTLVAYFLYAINDNALKRAEAEIEDRLRAEQTVRSQKEELEKINRELSVALEQMGRTNREYEKANTELTRAQTEILRKNDLLRESEEKFSKAFYLSPLMICMMTLPDLRFVEVSDHFCEIFGSVREEILGRTALDLNLWEDSVAYEKIKDLLGKNFVFREREITLRTAAGNSRHVLLSAELLELGGMPHAILVGVDITARKQAEREKALLETQLYQAQKMETIGRLAGGMAHDFNNLLTAIIGNTNLVMMTLPEEEDTYDHLQEIIKAASSATDLIQQLLAFARKQIIQPRAMDLSQLVTAIRSLVARLIGEDIRLEIVTDPAPCVVRADPSQLEQVIVNLAVNARDAMPEGGQLTLATRRVDLDDAYLEQHLYTRPGPHVMLEVSDTGTGMSPAVQAQVFEPFFTTKSKDKGTGLGLATVYGAVKQNGGSIEVYSEEGHGTTFKIYFAHQEEEVAEAEEVIPEAEAPGGTETVLLAEDSPPVLAFVRRTLEQLGYTVLAAGNGEEALEIAAQHPHAIDLLLTDVIMPGISGRELADRLRAVRRGLRVLFASGYTENAIVHHGVLEDGIRFIGKPYSVNALARKIREVLDE